MNYCGDFAEDSTIHIPLTTNDGSGGAVAPSDAFEVADIKIYKNGSANEKTTTNGITMTSPFDAITGLHSISIDTSVDTGDAGFWTTGADYWVILSPDTETVDSQTVVSVLATFSIENRFMRGTDSAALASVCTEARLSELDAANIPTDLNFISTLVNDIDTSTESAARFTEIKGSGWSTETLKDIRDNQDNLSSVNIVSSLAGSITVSYAENLGTVEVVQGDKVDISYGPFNKDITGRKLYFAAKEDHSDTAFAIATKEITSDVSDFSTFTGTIPITATESDIAVKDYYAEIESRDSDGVSNPFTELKFTLSIVNQVVD